MALTAGAEGGDDGGRKLTVYFGERDRAGGRLLGDALLDAFERHGFRAGVLLRGAEGFGLKHRLRTDRLENAAVDLPLVAVGVDRRDRVEAALPEVDALVRDGLVTLERARLLTGGLDRVLLPEAPHEATKLTVYCGRQERAGGVPAHLAVVDLLHRRGVDGATVLLGVDGTVHGERRRARFFGGNARVPLMVVAVGDGAVIATALPELGALLDEPVVTLERVRVCKRDGRRLAVPQPPPDGGDGGEEPWQKLMIHTSEATRVDGAAPHLELVRHLRAAGAAGATALRGVWGYHGDHPPHGDRLLSLRRHVPVLTVVVDRPELIGRWFGVVDELTPRTGLVTCETVPAFRAVAGREGEGRLRLG